MHPPFFSLAVEQRDVPTFVVQGDLDVASISRLCRVVDLLIGQEPALGIDLADVEFLDLVAARRLARLQATAAARGTDLAIAGASRPVGLVFELLGLAAVLAR